MEGLEAQHIELQGAIEKQSMEISFYLFIQACYHSVKLMKDHITLISTILFLTLANSNYTVFVLEFQFPPASHMIWQ